MVETVVTVTAVGLGLYVVALWVASVPLRDVSIVDLGWPVAFILVAWTAFAVGDGEVGRRILVAALVSLWGLRLAGHLVARKLTGPGEDPRYTAIRRRHGPRFVWTSLGVVFLFQGALMWVVSLPIQGSAASDEPLGVLDWVGIAACASGVAFEAVGDEQLRRFKVDSANRGGVLDSGLWRFTRHPNYFGDCTVWWGIYLIALSAGAWWTVLGPLVMTTLLLRVSGVRLLEAHLDGRPGYADYVGRTSAFVPLRPRGSRR